MRDKFVNGFMAKLYEEIPEEYLETVRNKLSLYVVIQQIKHCLFRHIKTGLL